VIKKVDPNAVATVIKTASSVTAPDVAKASKALDYFGTSSGQIKTGLCIGAGTVVGGGIVYMLGKGFILKTTTVTKAFSSCGSSYSYTKKVSYDLNTALMKKVGLTALSFFTKGKS
jgi:hypothetical protein